MADRRGPSAARLPGPVGAWVGTVAVSELLHRWVLMAVLVAPVVMVAGWARVLPVSYGRLLAGPVRRHRLRRRVRKSWPALMDRVAWPVGRR